MAKFIETTTKPSVTAVQARLPHIIISPDALTKMQIFIEKCNDEVGWLGIAVRDENTIYIDDVMLFDQEVNGATNEITPEGLAEFAEELLTHENGMEIWNNIRVWGHSHADMSATPSTQDDEQMETFADIGFDWFIRIIGNKKSTLCIDLYQYDMGVAFQNMPWREGLSDEEQELEDQINELWSKLEAIRKERYEKLEKPIVEEMKLKVRKKTYPTTKYTPGITYIQSGKTITPVGGTTDIKKKNTSTTVKPSEDESVGSDLFDSEDEVIEFFDQNTIFDIGESMTIYEVREALDINGYDEKDFTVADLMFIWSVCKNYTLGFYVNMRI